jgi:hypothetical protein
VPPQQPAHGNAVQLAHGHGWRAGEPGQRLGNAVAKPAIHPGTQPREGGELVTRDAGRMLRRGTHGNRLHDYWSLVPARSELIDARVSGVEPPKRRAAAVEQLGMPGNQVVDGLDVRRAGVTTILHFVHRCNDDAATV